jgi:hypothetical protein
VKKNLKRSRDVFEKWALKVINEHMETLNLQAYRLLGLKYGNGDGDGAFFRVSNNYPYKNISIIYYDETLTMFDNKEFDTLRYGLMHELVHIVCAEIQVKAQRRSTEVEVNDSVEHLVDHITNVVMKHVH